MPPRRYDHQPDWKYKFPTPTLDLSQEPSLVPPPGLNKLVGVDGRYKGTLRRFPGFELIRDLAVDISGLANIERVWSLSVQKGSSKYVLRGFVILADSLTDATYKALFFVAYDTETSAWADYVLEDFAVTEYIKNDSTIGNWLSPLVSMTDYVYAAESGALWDTQRSLLVRAISSNSGEVMSFFDVDIPSGVCRKFLGFDDISPVNQEPYGFTYESAADRYYNTEGGTTKRLVWYDPDDLSDQTIVGTYSPVKTIHDLAYDNTGDILYGIEKGSPDSSLWTVNRATAALTNEQTISGAANLATLTWDRTNSKLYAANATDLYEIDPSDGSKILVVSGLAIKDGLVKPPNSEVFYAAAPGHQSVEINPATPPHIFSEVDIASSRRYIYATIVTEDNRRPLNRAYYWDIEAGTMASRTAGFTSPAIHASQPIRETTEGVIAGSRVVSVAARYRSRKHSVAGPLSVVYRNQTTGAGNTARVAIILEKGILGTDIPRDDLQVEVFRTIGMSTALVQADLPLIGNLFLDQEEGSNDPANTTDDQFWVGSSNDEDGNAESDIALSARKIYDPVWDFVGVWPRTGRIVATDSQLYIVAYPYLGDDPSTSGVETHLEATSRVMWSPPEKYELEAFRGSVTGEQARFGDPSSVIYALERASDFVFLVTDRGVLRLHKSGAVVAVNPIELADGAESRDGAVTINNTLYLATISGLMMIEGRNLTVSGLGALQRLFTTTDFWRASIANVQLAYDAQLNALILFHTGNEEAYLMWPETGGITSLEDCPFIQVLEGTDPENGGAQRSFWVTAAGKVYSPDAAETVTRKTMCGVSSSVTVNGTATSGDATTLNDTGATFHANMVGFYVHFYTGANAGLKRKIVTQSATQLTWSSSLPLAIADGARYSVAPVSFRARGWQLLSDKTLDHFRRKIVKGMGAALRLRGGSTNPDTNPNMSMTYELYRRSDTNPVASVEVTMNEDPTAMAAPLSGAAALLYPEWVCRGSDIDFELLAGEVNGKLTTSESDSPP